MISDNLDSEKMYLAEIAQIPLLSPEEERELIIRVKNGDIEAKKRLIESNLRLVVSIAKKYYSKSLDFLDLIEEGNRGLVTASLKFNPQMNCKFSTYATWWIRKSIVEAMVNNSGMIRVPETIKDMTRFRSDFFSQFGREPSAEEISAGINVPRERVIAIMCAYKEMLSLNQSLLDDDKELEEVIADPSQNVEEDALNRLKHEQILKILKSIENVSERNLEIFLLRLGYIDGKCWTYSEIANKFDITFERARQIEKSVLARIRESSKRYLLAEFTENPSKSLENISENGQYQIDSIFFSERNDFVKSVIISLMSDFDIKPRKIEIFCLLYGLIDGKCWTYSEIRHTFGYNDSSIREAEKYVLAKIKGTHLRSLILSKKDELKESTKK